MIRYRDEMGRFVSAEQAANAEAMRAFGDSTAPQYERVNITYSWERRGAAQQGEFDWTKGGPYVGGGDTDRKTAGGGRETLPGRDTELEDIDYGERLDLSDLDGEEMEIEDPTGT